MKDKITRRRFLEGSAAGAIASAISSARAAGKNSDAISPGRTGAEEELDAGRGAETTGTFSHPPFQKPPDLPPLKLIRESVPEQETPSVRGEYSEAYVPDTCNLEERARLFVERYLVRVTIPELHYEPHDWGFYDQIPPRVTLGWGDYVCAWPKFRESLPLMRMMIGSQQGLEIDQAWGEHVLKCIGPDGLFYIPMVGRPWDGFQAYPWLASWLARYPSVEYYTYLPTVNGRLLGALAIYYKMTGDEIWNETARKIVDRMNELAIKVDNVASFPRFFFVPNETLSREETQKALASLKNQSGQETERNIALWHTWIVTGLSQYYRASGYEPAKDLAYGLVNYMRETKYVEEWKSHFHCITLAIQAMLELAQANHDMELAHYAQRAYEVAKSGQRSIAIPEIGYFVNGTGCDPMEGCSIGDMTAIAVKLAQLGLGDWEDVDRYVRNCLIEDQHTSPDQMREFCWKLVARGQAKEKPIEYTHLVDHFAERMVGSWSLHFLPNDLFGSAYFVTCCTGNCSRALYYAWESILNYEKNKGELKVNLLLNRTSPWADVNSYIPYTGRVEICVKKPCDSVKVRMSNWIEKDQVACKVNGTRQSFQWDGNYLALSKASPGQTITIEFPILERVEKLESFEHKYQGTFRGNDCVELTPKWDNHVPSQRPYSLSSGNSTMYLREGESNYPLFQRNSYRDEQPRYIKAKRFACENPIQW